MERDFQNRAFDLVKPATHWKDPINVKVLYKDFQAKCRTANVTLDDVTESILFMTATSARVRYEGDYIVITAKGYRAGPAGDH